MLILFGALGGGTGLWFKLKMTLRLLVQILHWKLIFQCLRYTKMCSKEASETWLFLKNEVDQCRILLCPKTNDNVTVEKHLYYFIKHVFLCLHWSLFFFFKSQCIEKKKNMTLFQICGLNSQGLGFQYFGRSTSLHCLSYLKFAFSNATFPFHHVMEHCGLMYWMVFFFHLPGLQSACSHL